MFRRKKKKVPKKRLDRLRRLIKHLGRNRGKYGLITGLGVGGGFGLKKGLALANYSPGDKKTLAQIKREQKHLIQIINQNKRR